MAMGKSYIKKRLMYNVRYLFQIQSGVARRSGAIVGPRSLSELFGKSGAPIP